MKRVKRVDSDPNPLFRQWLEEFREEARRKDNIALVRHYSTCLTSLGKYPLRLESGRHCRVLEGFGEHICNKLDKKLQEYRSQQLLVDLPLSPVPVNTLALGGDPSRSMGSRDGREPQSSTSTADRENMPNFALPSTSGEPLWPSPPRNSVPKRKSSEPYESPIKLKKTEASPPLSSVFDEEDNYEAENLLTREERELQKALQESKEEHERMVNESQRSQQLEEDLLLARELDSQLNGGITPPASPSEPAQSLVYRSPDSDSDDELPDPGEVGLPGHPSDDDADSVHNPAENLRQKRLEYFSRPATSLSSDDGPAIQSQRSTSPPPGISAAARSNSAERAAESGQGQSAIQRMLGNDPVFRSLFDKEFPAGRHGEEKRGKGARNVPGLATRPEEEGQTSARRSRSGPRKKEYVPKARSGAYGALLALYQASCEGDYPGYLRKTELQTRAQPLSDQPFGVRNAHSDYYTAWSGVSTLIRKGLVVKWSNPAKYKITEAGADLAARMDQAEQMMSQTTPAIAASSIVAPSQTGTSRSTHSTENTISANSKATNAHAAKRVDRQDGVATRIAPELPSWENMAQSPSIDLNSDDDNESEAGPSSLVFEAGVAGNEVHEEELPLSLRLYRQMPQAAKRSLETGGMDTHIPAFRLDAGSFDIVLCVDNTEAVGGGAGGRQTLKQETVRHLQASGVEYDRRNLNIGDFLWVARERRPAAGQSQPRELVLPYIVERKRLDDLWASVKDGRYEEQKFRMKSCGLSHLYYLIENFTRSQWQGGGYSPEAINQAIANTAVQEGFSILRSHDQRGSVEQLTLITRILRTKYCRLTLTSCTQADLFNGLVAERDTTLLSFKEFNDASKKNRRLSLKETFAKMLLKLKGLSVEMAHAIVEAYPTPMCLISALEACSSEADMVNLIQELDCGLKSRKIPRPIAEALFRVFTKQDISSS